MLASFCLRTQVLLRYSRNKFKIHNILTDDENIVKHVRGLQLLRRLNGFNKLISRVTGPL